MAQISHVKDIQNLTFELVLVYKQTYLLTVANAECSISLLITLRLSVSSPHDGLETIVSVV